MTKIPQKKDPTLEAMKRVIEGKQHLEQPRNYLGASLIGSECARRIWYTYNKFHCEPFSAQTLMNFEDGHRTEDLTAERLKSVKGITLRTHNTSGKQFGFSVFDGKFKGHYDGLILGLLQAPKTWHVWENKCSGDKKWKEFKRCKEKHGEKETLKNWSYPYYVQAQLYMHYEGMDRHYLTLAYAGGRNYESCRTEYDEAVASKYIERAHKIIEAKNEPPRIREEQDYYICKMCPYRAECHGIKEV